MEEEIVGFGGGDGRTGPKQSRGVRWGRLVVGKSGVRDWGRAWRGAVVGA